MILSGERHFDKEENVLKAGKMLESYVQFVYQKLLEFTDSEGTLVSTNVSILGKTGAKHEFDVYYEFEHLNIKHRIAIECKDWSKPLTIGEIRDFGAKLDDLNNISGVIVSKSGYQAGAKQYAQGKGIQLMEERDLPTFTDIVAGVIKKAFLPDKSVEGRPFWTLMEVQNGEITGTYCALPNMKKLTIPLFYSKVIAEKWRQKLPDAYCFVVRGISQYQLKGFVAQMEMLGVEAAVCCIPFLKDDDLKVPFIGIPCDKLKEEYVYL